MEKSEQFNKLTLWCKSIPIPYFSRHPWVSSSLLCFLNSLFYYWPLCSLAAISTSQWHLWSTKGPTLVPYLLLHSWGWCSGFFHVGSLSSTLGVLETTRSRPASKEYNLCSHTGPGAAKDPTLRKAHTWFNALLSSSWNSSFLNMGHIFVLHLVLQIMHWDWTQRLGFPTLAFVRISFMTLDKFLNLSQPYFPQLLNTERTTSVPQNCCKNYMG